MMLRRGLLVGALALSACGPVEFRVDETKGVPALKGSTEVTVPTNFTCGQAIPTGQYTVQTRAVNGGCEFSFSENVEVLKASDYESIGELKGASNLVQRVELSVKKLSFVDGSTGQALDLATRVTSASLSVNGQAVADKAALSKLPVVVSLTGDALTALKAKIDQRQPASVAVGVLVVLPNTPPPPAKLKIDYEAQPAIILGTGAVKLP